MIDQPLADTLATADEEMLREIVREAELHLASQQTVALAADQRAMTLVGFLTATVVVLVGAGASFAMGSDPNKALAAICILTAAVLLAAAGLAVTSAAPSGFDFAGSSPKDWRKDVEAGIGLHKALALQCKNYSEAIDDNHKRMANNGTMLWRAIKLSLSAIGVGGLAFVIALLAG